MRVVLVVEDDRDLRGMFRMALTLAGYRVVEAGDGFDALRQIDGNPPDLIVLDLGLPYVDGHAVLEEVTAHAHTRDIPIIVVTASTRDLRNVRASRLLKKPILPDALVSVVNDCLGEGSGSVRV